jgi:hypothetical protein
MNMTKRPPHGCENSSRLDLFQMELWTSDQLQMCVQAISPDTRSAISSPESEDGALLCNLQDGPQIVLCGQEAAPVSHSQPQEKGLLKPMNDISGLRSLISSRNADLNMSLGSRLQARLAKVGSMEYRQTWAKKVTPAGLPYWAHTASAVRISDKDCTGWPTPTVDDSSNVTRESGAFQSLTRTAQMAGWATPNANNMNDGEGLETWDALPDQEQSEARERQRSGNADSGSGADNHGMGNTINAGPQGHGRLIKQHDSQGREGEERYSAETGFWSDFTTVACRDGKTRRIPTEPAFFPLSYGVPARVVRLRGYGNAIVPQVAAEFAKAYLEISQ